MRAIFRREMQSYFHTPLGYVFLGVFLAISSLIFSVSNLATRSSDMGSFYSMMSYVWMLLCPLLVMRLIAGERKQLTEQLILTAPVHPFHIVLGKYLAACAMLLLSILASLVFSLMVAAKGRIYPMELFTACLGFALQGCAFIAFDLMLSSFSRNPVTASLICFGGNLLLWLSSISAAGAPRLVKQLLSYINLYDRFSPFVLGQLSFANLLFFVVFIGVNLVACVQIVDARRWSALA